MNGAQCIFGSGRASIEEPEEQPQVLRLAALAQDDSIFLLIGMAQERFLLDRGARMGYFAIQSECGKSEDEKNKARKVQAGELTAR